ncbi:DUF6776 family protein [Thiothrix sp.]|jgi:hypothetical protein|uniref:DUF6776 family protein n=1 Tax=Thiothrix sp. TaxID=1032 RepID=UPI00257D37B0|nr:DUF6776 family protein [Thiothrix sp.]
MALEYKFENRGTTQVRPTGSDKRNPCWYMLIAALLLVLMMATWLFFSGYLTPVDSSGAHAVTLRGKMDEQERLLTKQLADIKALEDQLATVKREQQVQVSANDELTKKFAAASAELASEREKLVLYEGILSPSGLAEGLHIQHFGVKPRMVDDKGKKVEGLYNYHLVLSNIKGGDTSVDGSYSITINGKQDGKDVTVTHKDVTPAADKLATKFSVKHYQSLEGNLLFPKDFVPVTVKLKVTPNTGDAPERLTRSYEWATFNDSNASTKKE